MLVNISIKAVKCNLRYLKDTLTYGLLLKPATQGQPFILDTDWAADTDDRHSISGSCSYFGPNWVSWWSRKQTLVARSSTEAGYCSLAVTTAEVIWLQSLLKELQVDTLAPIVYCDNLSTVSLSHNPVLHSRTKYMELDLFFVWERVIAKILSVCHITGQDQVADLLTKPSTQARFDELRSNLGAVDRFSIVHPP